MRRHPALAFALVVSLALPGALGCAAMQGDFWGHRRDLELSQRQYTQYLRWGEDDAAADFVAPEVRDDFLEATRGWEDVRFTAYQIRRVDVDEELTEAEVRVRYDAHHLKSLVQQEIYETQSWRRDPQRGWQVRPDFDHLRASLDALRP